MVQSHNLNIPGSSKQNEETYKYMDRLQICFQ